MSANTNHDNSTCIDVSIIVPVHNSENWLEDCLLSVYNQRHGLTVEISLFLDSCTDKSESIISSWSEKLSNLGYVINIATEDNIAPKGVGYAKNKAVNQSRGEFLCFLDSDDIMNEYRLKKQYDLASDHRNAIIGCKFTREPLGSTERYTKWANELSPDQLYAQIYTSNGPTVIMPTWFCHRDVFLRVGGFSEEGKGCPEDLLFFYTHLRHGGEVLCHPEYLLIYRYHADATTFSVLESTIWDLRIKEIEDRVIKNWQTFTIWNAGKQGRRFYRSLSTINQKKVTAFCDVDCKKVGSCYTYEECDEIPKPKIPIIHFTYAKPPIIVCVKLDLTGGSFEENLASLHLKEGEDFYHFN